MSKTESTQALTPPFAGLLRFWRQVHQVSQEELAYRTGSSARHISRLENGHVSPSYEMTLGIVNSLGMLERDANHLLIAAGFRAQGEKASFAAPELKWLRKAMTLTLRALDPNPTILIDGSGDILMVNRSWVGLYRAIVGEDALKNITNHFDLLFSLHNEFTGSDAYTDALCLILMSIQQDVLLTQDAAMQIRLRRLLATPGIPDDWARRAAQRDPMASFRVELMINGKLQRFFSVSQTVGAMGPTAYVSEPRLTINTLYQEVPQNTLPDCCTDQWEHPLLAY
ncbi:helix-turn-helix domain-containing protein [Salinimonas chungwhensis]|uniref:helix-turn-helix domain-containing protein n=1 Tax=Salinimonas chungwhensis TaxID=265425 RepID=UPI0003692206|nr:helix-turn-helix transcriptional regulator [Salinimonas chungwhensis]